MTQQSAFSAQLAAARSALVLAEKQSAPVAPELAQTLKEFNAAAYADCVAKMEAIAATVPALRETFEALAERACWKCQGSGDYNAPTSHFTRGRPVCWTCGGSGERKR